MTGLVVVTVIVVDIFVTGLNVKTEELEEEEVGLTGGFCGCVEIEEKTKGAFGIDDGAVVVPVKEAKTKAGQHT